MITKTKTIKRTSYYLSLKETEKIYKHFDANQITVTEYAREKGVGKSSFQQVLNGSLPLTKDMYRKAFADFDCIEVPPSYKL